MVQQEKASGSAVRVSPRCKRSPGLGRSSPSRHKSAAYIGFWSALLGNGICGFCLWLVYGKTSVPGDIGTGILAAHSALVGFLAAAVGAIASIVGLPARGWTRWLAAALLVLSVVLPSVTAILFFA